MYALVPLSRAGRPPVASGLALPSSLSARPRGAGSPQSVADSQALSCTSQAGELALLLSRWVMPLLTPWAPTSIPFRQMDVMFLKAEQGCWRPTHLPHLLAVCTWAGHVMALSLSFPIGTVRMKVPFFGKGVCTFIYFIAY